MPRRAVAWALAGAFLLRLLHLMFAVRSPLTYQPGPDEAYYIAFGRDVAFGSGGLQPLFGFMDPLYGYVVGAVLRLAGTLFPLYVLQIALDTATAYGLYRVACALGRPRVGLVAIVLYALTGTAIAYTASILKSTCDAAFMTWWMYLVVRAITEPSTRRWIVFGLLCGAGVALRSNFLLMTPLALVAAWIAAPSFRASWFRAAGGLMLGLVVPLTLLGVRNHVVSGTWSPLPTNGGIVLHQLYNDENPQSRSAVPSFVGHYTAPFDIWRGYAREAERRAGHRLQPHEVSAYWGREARGYLLSHPLQTARNGIRKLREFSAYPEVPNTRNYGDDRRFSPILRFLPMPFGWLFALGVPGLAWWAMRDRRALALVAPVLMGLVTIAMFFAEDRFRFDILTPFVLGAAAWLVAIAEWLRARRGARVAAGIAIPLALGIWSIAQARLLIPEFPGDWQRIVWGYIRSGRRVEAERELTAVAARSPDQDGLHELRGFLALQDSRPDIARRELERALERRPDRVATWQNYSLALERMGDRDGALAAAGHADVLDPTTESGVRVATLLIAMGREEDARNVLLAASERAGTPEQRRAIRQSMQTLEAKRGR